MMARSSSARAVSCLPLHHPPGLPRWSTWPTPMLGRRFPTPSACWVSWACCPIPATGEAAATRWVLLSAAPASVLAGARSLAAIGEWAADAPRWALRALGFPPDPLTGQVPVPHPATVRRLLARLDGDALDEAIGAFLTARARRPDGDAGRRAIAVDGKTLRGSRHADRTAVALPAAMEHTGSVLAQRQVAGKSNEIPAFAPLPDTVDLAGAVVTADALHTSTTTAPTCVPAAPTTWRS
ncbi:ISAs1 family transposase [Streptomyces sp. NPDC059866]|uniref:ISAs1 family transposase n=1 Tax=Streptomyces sp. NPDC059866 TaxID=3346978 RepID=UPI00366942C1